MNADVGRGILHSREAVPLSPCKIETCAELLVSLSVLARISMAVSRLDAMLCRISKMGETLGGATGSALESKCWKYQPKDPWKIMSLNVHLLQHKFDILRKTREESHRYGLRTVSPGDPRQGSRSGSDPPGCQWGNTQTLQHVT